MPCCSVPLIYAITLGRVEMPEMCLRFGSTFLDRTINPCLAGDQPTQQTKVVRLLSTVSVSVNSIDMRHLSDDAVMAATETPDPEVVVETRYRIYFAPSLILRLLWEIAAFDRS